MGQPVVGIQLEGTAQLRGTVLGHYEILEPLGAGGMGEVDRARDTLDGEPTRSCGL